MVMPNRDDRTIEIHRNVLTEVQLERQALLDRLAELDVVERYHAQRAGIDPPSTTDQNGASASHREEKKYVMRSIAKGVPKHEAAALALHFIGRPAKTGEIADKLLSLDYGTEMPRRIFFNGLYTAMKRHPETFEPTGNARWRLKPSAKEEKQDE